MDPVVWGSPLWALLHGAAHGGADRAVTAAAEAMRHTLPCCRCRASLRRLLPAVRELKLPPFAFTWALHNAVNRKLLAPSSFLP